jgi:hypothetical protein
MMPARQHALASAGLDARNIGAAMAGIRTRPRHEAGSVLGDADMAFQPLSAGNGFDGYDGLESPV